MFSIEEIKKNIHTFSSEKIAEMIVSCKYLKLDNKIMIVCMEELALRRIFDENFDFEKFINDKLKELPPIQAFNGFDIRDAMKSVMDGFKK